MTTTALQIRKKVNRTYVDVFIKRRLSDGTYESDWIDISRLVSRSGLGSISRKLDSDDFDVGIFTLGNVRLSFDNRSGAFNQPYDSRSLWAAFESRHLTKVKIEAGYLNDDGERITEEAFVGFLDERTVTVAANDAVSVTLLAIDSVFSTLSVSPGALSGAVDASEAIYILCSRGEVLEHITVLESNINPANDIEIDDPDEYDSRKLNDVLNEILLLSNSVMYVDADGNLIVRNREHSNLASFVFYSGSSDGSDNIYAIDEFSSGRHRVKNAWYWEGTNLSAVSDSHHLTRYGVTRRTMSADAVTDSSVRQSIIDALHAEWQFPKMELSIETDYLASELDLLDTVRVDIQPRVRGGDAQCDVAIADTDVCAEYSNGLYIPGYIGFKVLAIEHNLNDFTTRLKLREIGTELNDGVLDMTLTKAISVTFTAESTKNVDVSAYGMNAQRCNVDVIEPANSYATVSIDVSRPSTSIITLTSGVAITKTFTLLIVEVLP